MLRRLLDLIVAIGMLVPGVLVIAALALCRRPRVRRVSVYGRDGEPVAYHVLRLFPRGRALWALNYLLVLVPVITGRLSFTGSRVAWVGRYRSEIPADGLVTGSGARRRNLVRQLSENAHAFALMSHYVRAQSAAWRSFSGFRVQLRRAMWKPASGNALARRRGYTGSPAGAGVAPAIHLESHRGIHVSPPKRQIEIPAYAWNGARPGLLSPYVLQRRANLISDGPDGSDHRFALGVPLKAHLGLVVRLFLSLTLGAAPRRTPAVVNLLGVDIANIAMAVVLERIAAMARGSELRQVAFVNADCLNVGVRDARYHELLAHLPLVLADGIGIRQALNWFLGAGLKENVNGTDLFPHLCRLAADRKLSIYMLGARPGVAEAAARAAEQIAPGLRIAGTHDGYFAEAKTDAVIRDINASGADILLVAMGVPAQEFWIRDNAPLLRPKVAIGVGGLFDFYSGRIRRAPLWMREIGLEWVYRLLQEPGRMWRRYLVGNPLFLWRVWCWSRGLRRRVHVNAIQPREHPAATANPETGQ